MPRDVQVVQSGGKDFDGEAMKVVREYRFAPAKRHGAPGAMAINIEVNFKKY
jgi:TonB family protein